MQEKDKAMKDFEGYPDVAADIINALVYDGRQIVRQENLLSAPTETLYERKDILRNQYEDVEKYEILDGKVKVLYLIANQSTVDYKMLFRKAGYVGGAYRNQYEGKLADICPVVQLILYWGEKHWEKARTMKEKFQKRNFSEEVWKYIDDIRLNVWEMRHLSKDVRKRFRSDMRIVVDYLADEESHPSEQKIVHKEALINMIKVLSGNQDLDGTEEFLKEANLKEEDEISMRDIFAEYENRGREEGAEFGRLQIIQSFMDKLHLTVEEALEMAGIPEAEWSKYESKLKVQ